LTKAATFTMRVRLRDAATTRSRFILRYAVAKTRASLQSLYKRVAVEVSTI